MDTSPGTVFKYPQIYKSCIRNEYFNTKIFWSTILEVNIYIYIYVYIHMYIGMFISI
jgi:magnesium-transporting ATPase (P-type)